jgi:DNA end-binding protein Ku
MASTVWKGYISFGLISVPVRLFAAARENHVSFNQIHKVCGTRIKQQIFCPHCERVVERSELAKGYAVDKDAYVLVDDEELKSLEAESSEVMEILQFVHLDDVDPIYFQTSYYSVAEEPGRRAYGLLLQGMRQLNVAAIAKVTFHGREQVVVVRPYHKGLVLHTLYYNAEVREIAEYGKDDDLKLQPQEVQLAEQFMKQLVGKFEPEQYKDEYEARVESLVESKQAGQGVTNAQPQRRLAPVINLMDALKKSIEARQEEASNAGEEKKPPTAATGDEAAAQRKSPQRKRKAS